jgi:hypothetical protein
VFAFYLTEITHNTRPNKYGAAQSSHMDLKTIFYFVCVFCRFFILVALTSSSSVTNSTLREFVLLGLLCTSGGRVGVVSNKT